MTQTKTVEAPRRLQEGVGDLLTQLGLSLSGSLAKLKGDASTREYYRVPTPNKSFMAMLLPEQSMGYGAEEITKTSRPVSELPFVDVYNYLKSRHVQVPEIHGYDRKKGVLLLEDLGDNLLLGFAQQATPNQIQEVYELALEELEKLAVIPEKTNRDQSILFARQFDAELYNLEFVHFVEYGLDKKLKKPPSATDRQKILRELEKLTSFYLTWNQVVCHRDYHSRNLLILNDSANQRRLGVIDFQDALLAPLFYDLASLLRDSYIHLEGSMQSTLVENYRQRMKPHGFSHTSSKDEFRRAFDLMGLHRNLKAAGRFCFFDLEKGNPNYLPDVPRTLSYVQATLSQYDELACLNKLLEGPLQEIVETCPN